MAPDTATDSSADKARLVCPDCGHDYFSWIVEQVQFGPAYELNGNRYEEGDKMGPITDDHVEQDGVFCTDCESEHERDDLVPKDEYEGGDE